MEQRYIVMHQRGAGWFKLYENGQIEKPDGYKSDGKNWEFVGLIKKLPFGRYSSVIPRARCFEIPVEDFKFKNGKQKYLVVDRDHGTIRFWT